MATALAVDKTKKQYPAELESLLERIEQFRHAESHIEPHDQPVVSESVISAATELLQEITSRAQARGIPWQNPSAGWDEDGRISLCWRGEGKALMLIVAGSISEPVVSVVSRRGQAPIRELSSLQRAIDLTLDQLQRG